MCSDAAELCSDTLAVESLSRDRVNSLSHDGRSVAAQLNSDVIASVAPEPQRDLSRSAEWAVTNTPMRRQGAVTNSGGVQNAAGITATIPSIVTPTSPEPVSAVGRASKISLTSQQRPKSLDQEFTLLNLDIPNVTIHGVCLRFCFLLFSVLVFIKSCPFRVMIDQT